MTLRIPRRPRTRLRSRSLRRASATGTALVVALGPVVVGALLARSVGGDPMVSVNALIAGGGQRARVSRHHLRGCRSRMNARPIHAVRGLTAKARPAALRSPAPDSGLTLVTVRRSRRADPLGRSRRTPVEQRPKTGRPDGKCL
ncbi:hypothetical protein ACF1BN_07075 [Streptomyces sp. NPDC014861]|uniref:hypothetical protein n=1 Tax=Streptomyces sp. NPDC014861 TaxID=3364923 RepID=UPI003702B879